MPARINPPPSIGPCEPLEMDTSRATPGSPFPVPRPKVTSVPLGALDGRKRVTVGIDQSVRHFALALHCADDDSAHLWLYEDADEFGVRLLLGLRRWLHGTLSEVKLRSEVLHMSMEAPAFMQPTGAHKLGEVEGQVKTTMIEVFGVMNKLAYPTIINTSALKKFATGFGGSSKHPVPKSVVIKAIYKKWGVDIDDDNLADAYVCARISSAVVTGVTRYDYERDVLDKLVVHTEWEHKTEQKRSTRQRKRPSA